MSLKAVNESYRVLSPRALQSTRVAHINKYIRQMVETPVSGYSAFRGNAGIGVNSIWWQCNGYS